MDDDLFQALRATRTRLAWEQQVPPFMIFSDKALQDMAIKQPTTEAAFLDVHGVGQKKAERLGTEFLGTIRGYCGSSGATLDDSP
jgi:ATP-dependent DNA helicase RecQ